jgi:hypothetical protein
MLDMLLSDDDVAQDIHRATFTDDAPPLATLLDRPDVAPEVCKPSPVSDFGTNINLQQTSSEEQTGRKQKADGYATSLAQRRSHQRSRVKKKNEVGAADNHRQYCGARTLELHATSRLHHLACVLGLLRPSFHGDRMQATLVQSSVACHCLRSAVTYSMPLHRPFVSVALPSPRRCKL